MRPFAISLACLLAAIAGSAQQNKPPLASPSAGQYRLPPRTDASCPVSLHVGQRGLVYLYNAEHQSSPPQKTPAQRIDVNLTNLRAKDVVAVYAHVQGIPGVPHLSLMPLHPGPELLDLGSMQSPPSQPPQETTRVAPARKAPADSSEQPDGSLVFTPPASVQIKDQESKLSVPEPFHADLSIGAHGNATLEWTVQNVGGVQWVQIDRIVYADGTEWLRSQSGSCKVAPDPMVLVQ